MSFPPVATHWSRIFYFDLFRANPDDAAATPHDAGHGGRPIVRTLRRTSHAHPQETFMARNDSQHEFGLDRVKSPVVVGVIMLGIYVAMYLSVAAVVRVIAPEDAQASHDATPNAAAAKTAAAKATAADDSPSYRHHSRAGESPA